MATLDELIARKKRAHRDVTVYLDSEIADRIAALEQQILDIPDLRISDPRPKQLRDEITELQGQAAESLVTFRFEELPGQEWAELAALHLPRPGVALDQMYQFNYHEVGKAAAVASGGQLVDETVQPVTAEQWAALWPVLSGHEFERITVALIELNEWDPQRRIDSAKKASPAGSGSTSN